MSALNCFGTSQQVQNKSQILVQIFKTWIRTIGKRERELLGSKYQEKSLHTLSAVFRPPSAIRLDTSRSVMNLRPAEFPTEEEDFNCGKEQRLNKSNVK